MELSPILAPAAIVGGLLLFLVTVTGVGALDGLNAPGFFGMTIRLVGHVLFAVVGGALVGLGLYSL